MQKKLEQQLAEAQCALAAADEAVHTLAARESAAAASPTEYAVWRSEHDATQTEVERLTKLITIVEANLDAVRAADGDSSLRKRHAAQRKANGALSKRIRDDLAKANEILFSLMRDVASAAIEDLEINGKLPDDLDPLIGADHLARGKAAVPRKDLRTENLLLWVKSDNGHLIGDQDSVEDSGDGRGVLRTGAGWHPCRKQFFRSVSFHPAERGEIAQSLFNAIRLPFSDRPGIAWDGERFHGPRDCLAALNAKRTATQERPIEVELVVVPHAAPIKAEN